MDFLVYCLFMFAGMLVASFCGWLFFGWWVNKGATTERKGWIAALIAVITGAVGS